VDRQSFDRIITTAAISLNFHSLSEFRSIINEGCSLSRALRVDRDPTRSGVQNMLDPTGSILVTILAGKLLYIHLWLLDFPQFGYENHPAGHKNSVRFHFWNNICAYMSANLQPYTQTRFITYKPPFS